MQRLTPDAIIAKIAARQHGVASFAQLLGAGLSQSAIEWRTRTGRLHRIHRGVYAVGRAELGELGRWKAATLALGAGAAVSYRSAAELWRVLEPTAGFVHVSVPRRNGRSRRAGVIIHRCASLTAAEITLRKNIPVTRPQRTLVDLRRTLPPGELRNAIRQAELLDLPVDAAVLIPDGATSELELRFLGLCRRHRLPRPETNARVGRFRVDFLWREQRLIVETDGRRFHRGKLTSSADRARDRELTALGWLVLRFTYRDVTESPALVAKAIRTHLRDRKNEIDVDFSTL